MADKKIFREIEGIFGWIEKRNKLESKGHDDVVLDSKLQLQEFFKFLGVDEISDEEINALHEMAMLKREEQMKRDKHQEGKAQDTKEENCLTYKDLLRVFIPDDDLSEKQIENDLEREKKELMNAFRILTPSKSGDTIEISRLSKMLFLYEKDYTGQTNPAKQSRSEKDNSKEKERVMLKIDEILSDLKLQGDEEGVFNFKEYLNQQYRTTKK